MLQEQTANWVEFSTQEYLEYNRNKNAFELKMSRANCVIKKIGTDRMYKNCQQTTGNNDTELLQSIDLPELPENYEWKELSRDVWSSLKETGHWVKKIIVNGVEKLVAAGNSTGRYLFPPVEESCKQKLTPPRVSELNNGKVFSKCMEGPVIRALQETPIFKEVYFKVLRENGINPRTNEVFGAYMEDAVNEYQEKKGIKPTGKIDLNTYKSMANDQNPSTTPSSPPTPQPVIQQQPQKPRKEDTPYYWARPTTNNSTTNSNTNPVSSAPSNTSKLDMYNKARPKTNDNIKNQSSGTINTNASSIGSTSQTNTSKLDIYNKATPTVPKKDEDIFKD